MGIYCGCYKRNPAVQGWVDSVAPSPSFVYVQDENKFILKKKEMTCSAEKIFLLKASAYLISNI